MTKVLEHSRPGVSLLDFNPAEIKAFLQEKLSHHKINAAYIFGSFAKGQASAWSDIDLLIVMPTPAPFLERAREFDGVYQLGVPVDILVYTPEEFNQLKSSNVGFWKNFQEHNLRIV